MKIGKYQVKTLRFVRAISQIIFFLILPSLYINIFNGIKAVCLGIFNRNLNFAALFPQLISVIAIIPITIFLGRFFCGWMCAFGAMGDFISLLSKKIFKRKFRIGESTDKILKFTKYIWLIALIAGIWLFDIKIFSNSNPWDAFGMLLTPGKMPNFYYLAYSLTPALIILLLIILASFFVDRFFCRYLCPLGAILALLSKFRIIGILKPTEKCGKCHACTNSCPMGIPLYQKNSIKSAECIQCFECVTSCHRQNCVSSISGGDVRPVIAGTVTVAAMTGIYYAGSFISDKISNSAWISSESTKTSSQILYDDNSNTSSVYEGVQSSSSGSSQVSNLQNSSQTATALYKDGTYEGSGTGFRGGTTTVSVTIKNGKISDVELVSTDDDMPFFNRAYSTVTQSIISHQATNVDAVSGATYSSNGIIQAVADALSKAS